MIERIALVTASFGGLDRAPTFPAHGMIDSFIHTDERPAAAREGWIVHQPAAPGMARLAAKRFKCQIHRLDEVGDHAWLAWSDACFDFRSLDFLAEWAQLAGTDGSRAVFVPHPDRRTTAEEYAYVLAEIGRGTPYLASRYEAGPLERERARFALRHDLTRVPLWCGGLWLLANAPRAHAFLDAWWACVQEYSIFDQAALAPLLVEHGIQVVPANVNLYSNSLWSRRPHR